VDALLTRFRQQPYATPSVKECTDEVGEDVLSVLVARGDLVYVSSSVVFTSATYEEIKARVRTFVEKEGAITLSQARDLFDTSRKYAQAILEHLDEIGFTKRVGDERILKK
jgi:selenocysteine-specific elongation factor